MKSVFGLVGFCSMIGAIVCSLSGIMWLAGFGVPNCEPSIAGYSEFYATLFGCSFIACFGTFFLVSFACVANKLFSKG